LIDVERDELLRRNKIRYASGGQDDASRWIDSELDNARQLTEEGLIDKVIDGNQSTERIAEQLQT